MNDKNVGQTNSTIGEEKKHNPRLTKSREEFMQIMADLKLSYPKQIGRKEILNKYLKTYYV